MIKLKTMVLSGCVFLLLLSLSFSTHAGKKAPDGTKNYIITPKNGQTVANPIVVRFGLIGMGVAPSGVLKENTGHHHLLIDVEKLPPMDQPIPKDKKHIHFGGGQTETVITLEPGQHTLQLILGDLAHVPFDPVVMSEKVTITVK